MKKVFLLLMVAFIFSCTQSPEQTSVTFSANSIESGTLKSFDITQWEHFHYPYEVIVTLKNTETGKQYSSKAANGNVFFKLGTEMTYLPGGKYLCSVKGGGYVKDSVYSTSYYIWSITDTTINIPAGYETLIRFNLDKTSALVIKDETTDLKLIAERNSDLFFTGRGKYDFAYVTAGIYSGLYTDSLGYQHNTEWFSIKQDNYYYFLPIKGAKSAAVVPTFSKNEIAP